MTPRFTADTSGAILGSILTLDATQSRHLLRVLRAERGARLTVIGGGREFSAILTGLQDDLARVELLDEVITNRPPGIRITYTLPWLKGGRTEFVVQKLTELGVLTVIVFTSGREVAHGSDAKLERLRTVALESCKQCGRSEPPEISAQPSLIAAIESYHMPRERCIVLYEREKTIRLTEALATAGLGPISRAEQGALFLASGPEGGFSEHEMESVKEGTTVVSLGTKILRAETAPIAAVSAVLAICGEF